MTTQNNQFGYKKHYLLYHRDDTSPLNLTLYPSMKEVESQLRWQEKGGFPRDALGVAFNLNGLWWDNDNPSVQVVLQRGIFTEEAFSRLQRLISLEYTLFCREGYGWAISDEDKKELSVLRERHYY